MEEGKDLRSSSRTEITKLPENTIAIPASTTPRIKKDSAPIITWFSFAETLIR
jgi:hypothetical protein